MRTIVVDGAWPKIAKATHADRGRRMLAVAYATELHVRLGKGDILVVNAATPTIAAGETSATLLVDLHRKGVEVYGLDSLHAKLGVLGRHSIIGSANLSRSSAEQLSEAVLITDDDAIRAQVVSTVSGLREISVRLDDASLANLCRIPVVRRGDGGRKRKKTVPDAGNQTWLVGGRYLSYVRQQTQDLVDAGADEARDLLNADDDYEPSWFGVNVRTPMGRAAKPGDRIIRILRHERGIDVLPPRPIQYCKRSATRCVAYMEPGEDDVVGWREFSSWASSVGLRVGKLGCRALSDREVALIRTFSAWPS